MRSSAPPIPLDSIKILVVEESAGFRKDMSEAIRVVTGTGVIGTARSGDEAVEKTALLKPDIITLDMELPSRGGLAALEKLRLLHPGVCIILVAFSESIPVLRGLISAKWENTAFLTKETSPGSAGNREGLERQLTALLERFLQKSSPLLPTVVKPLGSAPPPGLSGPMRKTSVVAIGASTGGPEALGEVLSGLPEDFPAAVLIVQHMQSGFTSFLVGTLAVKSKLPVEEAAQGQCVEKGRVYIAPAGMQMKVVLDRENRIRIELVDDPPENFCKPAVDYLFRSVANVYGGAAIAVILTGIGCDGTSGIRIMKQHGVKVIGQDKETCVVYGMPRVAKEAGLVDAELPLGRIAAGIINQMRP